MKNNFLVIAVIFIIALAVVNLGKGVELNTQRLVSPGSLLMILGGILVFFSRQISKVIGWKGERGNIALKLSGIGLLILGMIILFTTSV